MGAVQGCPGLEEERQAGKSQPSQARRAVRGAETAPARRARPRWPGGPHLHPPQPTSHPTCGQTHTQPSTVARVRPAYGSHYCPPVHTGPGRTTHARHLVPTHTNHTSHHDKPTRGAHAQHHHEDTCSRPPRRHRWRHTSPATGLRPGNPAAVTRPCSHTAHGDTRRSHSPATARTAEEPGPQTSAAVAPRRPCSEPSTH